MPTRAELPRSNHLSYQEGHSWTDDLPVCRQSGVGFSTNQIYREDGYRQEEHQFEDRSFHFCVDDGTFLYGVFDGHEGTQAATFALQRMPAEILLGQLLGKTTDEEVKEVLRQAFISVEKGYFDSIDDRLAERTSLQYEIPDGLTSYEVYQKYPDLIDKLNALNCELSAGTTAVVALIYRGRLYVANVGDSRALLCRTDANGVLRVVQLSVDHDMKNEDEVLRLSQLGLDTEKVQQVKGAYKEFEELTSAAGEPVIAEPEIHGGIPLDESCRFLLLMSDGLYKSLEEATGTDQVNKEIAQMAVEQFRVQSTLNGVAQTVVEKIGRIHHDSYMNGSTPGGNSRVSGRRDDMTFLVRNFNFAMPNALNSPTNAVVRFNPVVTTVSSSSWGAGEDTTTTENTDTCGTNTTEDQNNDTSTTESSSDLFPARTNPTDKDKRIEPYVDFSDFYQNIEKARREGTLPTDIDF
ncbi:Probable protein phosphatase CG10417 [Gryllus bimaculatus]|nr:Probable protein phosphatase CG10417 [Gryllus bimaculatus]